MEVRADSGATAFAYGMLQELQATQTGTPNGLLDHVRLVRHAAQPARIDPP